MLRNRGAAFGPVFEGDPSRIHDADEGMTEENFWKHAEICLEAVRLMAE